MSCRCFWFRGGTEASTSGRRSRLRENALQFGTGKWPRCSPKRADVRAAANFSRLTGRQAGKPQASELQAETREARLAIDRLHLRLQLSCPPPPPLADSHHPVKRCGACRSVSQRDPLYLCFQPPNKLRLHSPLYNTLRVNSINWTHLSRAHSSTGFRLPRF